MIKRRVRLLLLDDDERLRSELKEFLERGFGYQVDDAADRAAAVRLASEADGGYDVALIDQVLAEGPVGIQAMQEIKALDQELEAIIFTARGPEFRKEALRAGAFHYIEKPVNPDELAQLIRIAAQQAKLREITRTIFTTRDLEHVLDEIVDAATSLASADDAAIVLLNPVSEALDIHGATQYDEPVWRKTLKKGSLSRWIIETGEMFWIGDTVEDARVDPGVVNAGIRSFHGLPIPGEGCNLGVLYVYSHAPGRFGNWGTISVLQALAGQAGLALSNLRAFQRVREQAGHMEALVLTSRGLTQAKKLNKQMRLVDAFMRKQLQVSIFYVGLYKKRTGLLRVPLARDHGKRMWPDDLPLKDDDGNWTASGYVIRTGQELYWGSQSEKVQKCMDLGIRTGRFGTPPPPETCFFVPLKLGQKVIGLISIQSTELRAFSPELLDAFRALANQLSAALESRRLLKRSRAAAGQLSALNNVVLEISKESNRAALLQKVIEQATRLLDAEGATIFQINPAGDRFERVAQAGLPLDFDGVIAFHEGLTGDAIEAGSALQVPDYQNWEKRLAKLEHQPLTAVAVAPIEVDGRILGTVVLHDTRPGKPFDRLLLERFADHAGLALKKAGLLEQVRKAKQAAEVVAQVTVLGEPKEALRAVARGTQEALDCDAVALFVYDQESGKLGHPPTMEGVWFEDRASQLKEVDPDSIVYTMLHHDGLYIVERVTEDAYFRDRRFAQDEKIESCVAIPLRVADQIVGVMFVNYRKRHRFTEDELTNLELFSNQAAVAIQNAQLYEKRQRWADVQEALYRASRIITGSLDLQEVLGHIAEQAWRVCWRPDKELALLGGVALVEQGILTHAAAYPPQSSEDFTAVTGGIKLSPDDGARIGIMGRAALTGESQVVGDVTGNLDYVQVTQRTRSELAVPMLVGGEVVGVINVEHAEPDAFGSDDVMALHSLAAQAGLAIQHARLYQAERQHAQAMEAIQATSSAVSAILDLEELFPMITREAAGKFSAPASSLMLWDKDRESLVIRAASGLGDRYRREQRISCGTVDSLVAKCGLCPHVFNISQVPLGRPDLIEEEQLCTALVAPLVKGEVLIGILCVYSRHEPRSFSDREVELARIFANHAAIAIQNAKLYDDLKRTKGLVGARTALAWMGMTSSAWRHSIDNNAVIIQEQAQLLRRDWEREERHPPGAKALDRITTIERLTAEILRKPITPPLSAEAGIKSVALNALVAERAQQLWADEPYSKATLGLNLELCEDATVRASPEWLRRAFDILLDNAVDAIAGQPRQEITISTCARNAGAQIHIADTGAGIPENIQVRIGLDPIEKPEDAQGLGMGLLMAQAIVQTYGGELQVEKTDPEGTTMVIWLPLEKGRKEDK